MERDVLFFERKQNWIAHFVDSVRNDEARYWAAQKGLGAAKMVVVLWEAEVEINFAARLLIHRWQSREAGAPNCQLKLKVRLLSFLSAAVPSVLSTLRIRKEE